ncbi:MAG: extracellular solute-binding protein [Clostridia bacterium]|nr:extracellular solute-binding protein [Clostridia bacterium]
MKKLPIKILLLLLSLLLLVSCTNVVMPTPEVSLPGEESKSESQIMEEFLSQLPVVESSEIEEIVGQPFTVLTTDETLFFGEETAAGSIRNALQSRNELFLSAYEMELTVVTVPEDEIVEVLTAAMESGVAAGDLLCYSAETTAALFAAGLLQDMNRLPYFDPNTACLDAVSATELAYRGQVYAMPDPSAQSRDEMFVMFYDRDLVEKAGLERPENLVLRGEWTYEAFQTYSETIAAEAMENASHDLAKDVFGYSSPDHTILLPNLLWSCGRDSILVYDETGMLSFPYEKETYLEAISLQRGIYDSKSRHPLDGEEAQQAFTKGRVGFLIEQLEFIKALYTKSSRSYGILPMPKKEGATRYSCPVSASGKLLSVPKLMNNPAKTGLGLTALCTAGGFLVRRAEKETYISLYSTDNDQSCMLEIILDSQYFDFATVFGGIDPSISGLTTDLLSYVMVDDSSRLSSLIRHGKEDLAAYLPKLEAILHPAVDVPEEEVS